MSKVTNQKIVEFLYKNGLMTSLLIMGVILYFSFFHQTVSKFRSEFVSIIFILIYPMTFLFRRSIGRVYDEVVVVYSPTKAYHKLLKRELLLFLFLLPVIFGIFYFMNNGYEGLGILILVLVSIVCLLYTSPSPRDRG